MAGNQVGYLINPSNSRTVGARNTSGTTSTAATAVANDKVSSFSITSQYVGTAGTDFVTVILTIGTAKFNIMCNSAVNFGAQSTITSDSLGYKGGFLQAGDTITLQTLYSGSPVGEVAVALAIDNYTA